MRRAAPPSLRLDVKEVPAFSRVAGTPRGLGFPPGEPPANASTDPGPSLLLAHGAPTAVSELTMVAGGELAVASVPGVAYTFRAPVLERFHDRRPPGLSRALGAAMSNVGLLLADDGWRAVVLPSLGDLAADLGDGPVALRADGRLLAAAADGAVAEIALPAGEQQATHAASPAALCYAGETLLVAVGAAVGPPGIDPVEGSPALDLAGAASAPRAASRHADGSVSIWDEAGERIASWTAPIAGSLSLAMSADGEHVALGTTHGDPAAAALVRADDGALVRYVDGARAISPSPAGDGVVVGGDWGAVWLRDTGRKQ